MRREGAVCAVALARDCVGGDGLSMGACRTQTATTDIPTESNMTARYNI